MIQWAWSYLTYERGARLITGRNNLPGWDEMVKQEEMHEQRLRIEAARIRQAVIRKF